MGIIYTTGTINQPDAASVGLAMAEKIRDDVIAHAAWDLVEEFTAAAGTVRWYVFKCLATESGLSADFFVIIGRTLSNGELRTFICEQYTQATHTAKYYAPGVYLGSYGPYDGLGRYTPDYILGTTQLAVGGGLPTFGAWVPSGTSTKWWITVDNDGFTVAFNGASNGYFHFGAYIPLTQMPMLLPVQMTASTYWGYGNSNPDYGMLTRNPGVAGISFKGTAFAIYSPMWLGFGGEWTANDKLQGDQRNAAELGIAIYSSTAGDQAGQGYALGKHKRIRGGGTSLPATIAFGDAYVMNGTLWVPYKPDVAKIWDTGVVA